MENKERDALIESIYEEVDSLSDKLYNIVWEPQEPTRKNHFDTLPKGAEYFENKYGHIVSSEIIYTGKYLRISNFSK